MSEIMAASVLATPFAIPVFVVASFAAALSVCFVAVQWRKARVAAYAARLKQVMIERGMTAQEIVAVIQSGEKPEEKVCWGRLRRALDM